MTKAEQVTKPVTAEAEAPAKPVTIEVGKTVRLRAVHGRIQNPFTLTWFDVGNSVKVVADSWDKIQFDAGKLAIDED